MHSVGRQQLKAHRRSVPFSLLHPQPCCHSEQSSSQQATSKPCRKPHSSREGCGSSIPLSVSVQTTEKYSAGCFSVVVLDSRISACWEGLNPGLMLPALASWSSLTSLPIAMATRPVSISQGKRRWKRGQKEERRVVLEEESLDSCGPVLSGNFMGGAGAWNTASLSPGTNKTVGVLGGPLLFPAEI